MSRVWSSSCGGKRYLVDQFKLFEASKGAKGIDPSLTSLANRDIKTEVYDLHPSLQQYKRERFPYNFRDTVSSYRVDSTKSGQRKEGKGARKQRKFFFVVVYLF